mgnify:FL=1
MLQFLYSLWIGSKKGLKFNMKRQTPQQTLEIYKSGITDSIQRWKFLDTHGGSDPFWSDGCNMNLVRNHILYYRRQLELLCESEKWGLPSEYYLPLPPIVPDTYMANKKQKERIQKLAAYNRMLTFEKVAYDDSQLSFFI